MFEEQLAILNKGDRIRAERNQSLLTLQLNQLDSKQKDNIVNAAYQNKGLEKKKNSLSLLPAENLDLDNSYKLVNENDESFKNFFAKTAMRNFVGPNQALSPMQQGRPRPVYTDKLSGPNESRFDNLNLLPNISSKFIRDDRGFQLANYSPRDDRAIINKEYSGGQFYNKNINAMKPGVKNVVPFAKQTERKALFKGSSGDNGMLSYADRNMQGVDNKLCLRRNSHLGTNWANMERSAGRDNRMYYLSDGYNLEDKNDNAFTDLVKIHTMKKSPVNIAAAMAERQVGSGLAVIPDQASARTGENTMKERDE